MSHAVPRLAFAVQLRDHTAPQQWTRFLSMHGREGKQPLCTPTRGLQLCMCDCMVTLQAHEQVLLTASAMDCPALKLCCACGLLEHLCPCHGPIEGAQHVCRPACLQPELLCLQQQVRPCMCSVCGLRRMSEGLCACSTAGKHGSLVTCRQVALAAQASAHLMCILGCPNFFT